MQKLIVLDYCSAKVHIYDVSPYLDIDDEFVYDVLGFNEDETKWMSGDLNIEFHNDVLE